MDEDSFSADEFDSDFESSEEETHPITRNQIKTEETKEKAKRPWKQTMSDISVHSNLFFDSVEEK